MIYRYKKTVVVHLFCLGVLCTGHEAIFAQAAGNASYAESHRAMYDDETGYEGTKSKPQATPDYANYLYPTPEATATIMNDTVIEMGTRALMNVNANSYVAIFGTSQVAENLDSCYTLINQRIDNFIRRLQVLGINKNDIYIDFISQVPVFEYEVEKKLFSKKYIEIPKGFELKKNIHIAYKENSMLDEILKEAARNEIYDVIKVDNIIDNVEAIYDTLRNAAIKTLNRKTEDMKKLGIKFSTAEFTVVAEDMSCFYPTDRYKSFTSFSNVSLGGLSQITSSATVHKIPKTLSLFYNKVPYSGYEVVINPKLVEPAAQFTYNVRIRYTYKSAPVVQKDKPAAQTTPNGSGK